MLREEVLVEWGKVKSKIDTIRLSPKEKIMARFLSESKTKNFIHNLIDNSQLDELKKQINKEKDKCNELEIEENELLLDYLFTWSNLNSIILDWINLRKFCETYRGLHNDPDFLTKRLKEIETSEPTIEEVD